MPHIPGVYWRKPYCATLLTRFQAIGVIAKMRRYAIGSYSEMPALNQASPIC
jgi:hypothetical protein